MEHVHDDSDLDIYLFGEPEVWRIAGEGTHRLELKGLTGQPQRPRVPWLLAYLAMRAQGSEPEKGWVKTEELERNLVHGVANPRGYIQALVSHLRKALGDSGPHYRYVQRLDRAYRLNVEPDQVDVHRFYKAVTRAERNGEWAEALALYQRGRFLPGCDDGWARTVRAELNRRYVTVVEGLADQAFGEEDDQWDQALRLVEAAAIDPKNEPPFRTLMRMHIEDLDFRRAHAVYVNLCRRRMEEYGERPDAETQELGRQARRLKRRLEQKSKAPTLEGASEERDSRFTVPASMANGAILGRTHALRHLRHLLSRYPVVCLTGFGGIGKTRLACEAASQMYRFLDRFSDGVQYVDLEKITDEERVPLEIAGNVGLRDQPLDKGQSETAAAPDATEDLCRALAEKRLLIVLDTCDRVREECARVCRAIADRCPGVRILATCRERLGLTEVERAVAVPPLRVPSAEECASADWVHLRQYPSVALFLQRAYHDRPGRDDPDIDQQRAILLLCRHLEGIPLALEIVAARATAVSPSLILADLERRPRLPVLSGDDASRPERQQGLAQCIDWSVGLLTESEARLLRRLTVFSGSCSAEAIAHICGEGLQPVHDLQRLADYHLVREDKGRYRLWDAVRWYIDEVGDSTQDTIPEVELRRRHLEYYLAVARGAWQCYERRDGRQLSDGLRTCAEDRDNLLAALDFGIDQRDTQSALEIGAVLGPHWQALGHFREGARVLTRALAEDRTPSRWRGWALYYAGVMRYRLGQPSHAEALWEDAESLLRLHPQIGQDDPRLESNVLNGLGVAAYGRGDARRALKYETRGYEIRSQMGDMPHASRTLSNMANTWKMLALTRTQEGPLFRARLAKAWKLAEQALRMARDHSASTHDALLVQGNIKLAEGNPQEAGNLYRQAEEATTAGGPNHAAAVHGLGIAAWDTGDMAGAEQHFRQALEEARKAEDGLQISLCLLDLAMLLSGTDPVRALEYAEEGLKVTDSREYLPPAVATLQAIATVVAPFRPQEAAWLIGAVGERARYVHVFDNARCFQGLYGRAKAAVERQLGEVRWHRAVRSGAAADWEAVLNRALGICRARYELPVE